MRRKCAARRNKRGEKECVIKEQVLLPDFVSLFNYVNFCLGVGKWSLRLRESGGKSPGCAWWLKTEFVRAPACEHDLFAHARGKWKLCACGFSVFRAGL